MARRGADNQDNESAVPAESPLDMTPADEILSFGNGEFADDTVIRATDEVFALLGSIALPRADAGLEASLGWNFFVFG